MKRSLALLVLVLAVNLAVSSAQNPPAPVVEEHPAPPMRVGPPPHDATPAQLEVQADKLRAAKSYLDALDYYRAALKKAPTATLWNKIGITELQLSRYKDAAKSFDRAIKMDHTFAEPYNNRGAVYYIEGAQRQAKAEQRGKGVPGASRKDYRKALKLYLKAVELDERNAPFHSNLGMVFFALKQVPLAVQEYARALQLDPDVFEHRSTAGIAAQMSSPEDRAEFSFVLARMFAKSGNVDRALEYLRRAMEDGYKQIDTVYKDQEFAAVRKDPRFAGLMASRPPAIPQ